MHGAFQRNLQEERRARIFEASGYPGPIAAGLVGAEEKTRFVRIAAEQRRLLREAGLVPPRDNRGIGERAAAQLQRIVARLMPPKSTISTPDHA